jgi:hypothetical protein
MKEAGTRKKEWGLEEDQRLGKRGRANEAEARSEFTLSALNSSSKGRTIGNKNLSRSTTLDTAQFSTHSLLSTAKK